MIALQAPSATSGDALSETLCRTNKPLTPTATLQAFSMQKKAEHAVPLIFIHLIGQMRLAQIEFALNPAPCFVRELAGAEKVIGPLPLGPDHQEFDFLMQLGKLLVPVVAVCVMLNVSEADTVLGAQRRDDSIRKGTLCGKLVEPRNRGFDGSASGSVLLSLHTSPLAPARMRKPKRADHKRQSE